MSRAALRLRHRLRTGGGRQGVHALVSPVEGAAVTWSCPADTAGPPPQTLKLVVSKDGFTATRIPFGKLRDPSRSDSLRVVRAAVELRSVTPEPGDKPETEALHCLDLPKAAAGPGGLDAPMLAVEVAGNGFRLNVTPVEPNALVREIREAKAKAPEVRAIVRADRRAAYGEVIGAIDLVKQASVAKLALAVSVPRARRIAISASPSSATGRRPHGAVFAALDAARRAKIARVAFTGAP